MRPRRSFKVPKDQETKKGYREDGDIGATVGNIVPMADGIARQV